MAHRQQHHTRRRPIVLAVVAGAAAGCTTESETASTTENTTAMPTVQATDIETTAVSAGGDGTAQSTYTFDDTTVEVTGTIPTRAVCPDRRAVITEAGIEDRTLRVHIDTTRENETTLCQDVLGGVEFQATVTVTHPDAIAAVQIVLPEEPV